MDYRVEIVARLNTDDQVSVIIDNQVESREEAIAAMFRLMAEVAKQTKDKALSMMLDSIIEEMPSEEAKNLRIKMLKNPKVKELLLSSLWNLLEAQAQMS